MQIFLTLLAIASTMGVYIALQRLLAPAKKDEKSVLDDLLVAKAKETSAFAKLDPDNNILDKIDFFLARRMKLDAKLEEIHILLGSPEKPNPLNMLHTKMIAALVMPAFAIFVSGTWLAIITMPIGFILPDLIYKAKIGRRQEAILANFPTTVDLSALIIESGLDYMTAFDRIIKIAPKKTELELELEKTLNEVQLGYSRRDALQHLAMRTGLQEIRSFVGLIVQSDELGTSLVELLRNFSTDMRFRRLNRAEKLAAQASTKMLIPLFIFIFPTVFILMLAPLVTDLFKGGIPF